MRNTPILIPIILVICLGTLTYLLYAALTTTAPAGYGSTSGAVALNSGSASTPGGARSTPASAGNRDDNLDRYFQEVPESQLSEPGFGYDDSGQALEPDEDIELHGMENDLTKQILEDQAGAYAILAGSFRQLINAEGQVRKLKKAGFTESKIMKSTGGAYAMAIVGRRATRADAEQLLAEVKRKGFDARVVKR